MRIKVPDELKANVPQTAWGKMLATTPVVMAVLATLLAALASGEMTRAQYARSLAAQRQSKAGDQWGFFQAKRMRSANQRNTLDLLRTIAEPGPPILLDLKQSAAALPAQLDRLVDEIEIAHRSLSPDDDPANNLAVRRETLEKYLAMAAQRKAEAQAVSSELLAMLGSPEAAAALAAMQRDELPSAGPEPTLEPKLKAALAALDSSAPESDISAAVSAVSDAALDEALSAARDRTGALDAATKPINQTIDRLEKLLNRESPLLQEARSVLLLGKGATRLAPPQEALVAAAALPRPGTRDLTAARLRYSALRYDTEARLNQNIANFYELQVRKGNLTAERHHRRSQRFFYGMLAAQMGVIIATFAMALRRRNLLWSIAAGAGLVAVAFGAYVYLYV